MTYVLPVPPRPSGAIVLKRVRRQALDGGGVLET